MGLDISLDSHKLNLIGVANYLPQESRQSEQREISANKGGDCERIPRGVGGTGILIQV